MLSVVPLESVLVRISLVQQQQRVAQLQVDSLHRELEILQQLQVDPLTMVE